ncbi:hypothetical protein Pla52n_03940 [Stieleria varia]|uniref:Uncharacterized protein n=1 Tax=Stieleria varia TaxID=2528005 RepID=A0A5C6B930_9BACT|nr:hypothetical protein Pla52n_03940 [Stieleria varia]
MDAPVSGELCPVQWKVPKAARWDLVERRKAEVLVAKTTDDSSTEFG